MTAVVVFPGADNPTHDRSLSDGTNTYGFTFARGLRAWNEVPLTPPASAFEIEQRTFVGGRGRIRFADDNTGFNHSVAWTTSDNRIMPPPQWRFCLRLDADEHLPGDNTIAAWWKLYGNTPASKICRFLEMPWTAGSSTAMDKAYLYIKRIGNPSALTLEICAANGTVLKTVTKTYFDVDAIVSVYQTFNLENLGRTSATGYILKIYGGILNNATDHWEILVDTVGTAGKYSPNGITWTSAGCSLFFRVTGVDTARQWKFFTLAGGTYAVSINDDRSTSILRMNGVRGDVKSATTTTLVSTKSGVTSNQYAGAFLRIIDGTGDGQFKEIISNTATTGGDVEFTVSAWDQTPDSTSKFITYGTNVFLGNIDGLGTSGLGSVSGQPITCSGIAYFPQGTATPVRRMRVNGNSHDYDSESPVTVYDILYPNIDPKNGLQIYGANASLSTIAIAPSVGWGSNLSFLSPHVVGTSDYRITNIYNYDGTLFVMKEDGKYTFDGVKVDRIGANFGDVPDKNNGASIGADDKYMWWSWGHSAVRTLGNSDTDMLNFRQGYEGLPANQRGVVSSIVSGIGWMFFVIDGGVSNYSSIMIWNGFGWHQIFKGWAPGVRIRNSFWQANLGTRPRLFFDINGEIAYMEFPLYTANPLKDSTFNYHHEFLLTTSTIDASDALLYKIIKSVHSLLETNIPIEIDYQYNENCGSDGWTNFGISTTAPTGELLLNLGEIFQIRLRIRGQCLVSRYPPVSNGWLVEGRKIQNSKYQFIGTFVAGTNLDTGNDEPDYSWNVIYPWLKQCAERQTKLTMRSLEQSSDNLIVTVSLPSKDVDVVDESEWEGRVSFAILQT